MCDTFVALPNAASDHAVVFGKNSDREPNEAQSLEYYPAAGHTDQEKLKCTYIEIPQVRETLAVLLSRPFWMWGAEMGANERGLVIGNEAVFTRMPYDRAGGLTGMDLLRLALERSVTAAQGLETIVQLLSDYGQGGICGYEDKKQVYHNSFILADPAEAWVLETAGPMWAAVKVRDVYSISNGLTIGEEFDESHPDLIETARKNKWLKKGETFNFAKNYSDWFYTTFSASRTRRGCTYDLLKSNTGRIDLSLALTILRDHQEEDYRPDSHLLLDRVCAHAANNLTRKAAQSTGSLAARLTPDAQTFFATGTSAPCTGIFKPVWFEGGVLPDIGPVPQGRYDPETLWWKHEMLHRSVILDYPTRIAAYNSERDELEKSFIDRALKAGPGDRFPVTVDAFDRAGDKTSVWIERVRGLPVKKRAKLIYRRFWKKQNARAGIGL